MIGSVHVSTTVNGEAVEYLCRPQQSLLECLRDVLHLTGTKNGCNDGNCGACSVLLDGRLVNSCLVLGAEVGGREIVTVEGLARSGELHPIQQAFIDEDGLQCGFCTPGLLLATKALLDRNPDPDDGEIRRRLAGNLCRCTGYETVVRSVRRAADLLAGRKPPARPSKTVDSPFEVIGTTPPRVDGPAKVTGRAVFGADVRVTGLLHGRVLRSPHAHALIRSIDTSKAEALSGVKAVATAADLRDTGDAEYVRFLCDNTVASEKALYVGHAIAAVAASSAEAAAEALALIDVDYQTLPAVTDLEEAIREDAPLLHPDLRTKGIAGTSDKPSNIARHIQHLKGDPAIGFAEAEEVVERRFRTAMVHQGYIEPQSATAMWSADGTLTVHATTQGAFDLRAEIGSVLDLPLSRIHVVPTEIGGGFGGKIRAAVAIPAAILSHKSGRPVEITMSRYDVLTGTGPSPGASVRVKMGATRDGRISAVEAELYYEAGGYPGAMIDSGAHTMFGSYDIPHGRVDAYDVVVNRPQVAAFRAPCSIPPNFAVEQVIDELAERLDIDPLEMRLRNAVDEGTRLLDGSTHNDIGCRQVLEAARGHPHYTAPLPGPNGGRGVAHSFWTNWGAQSSCTLSVHPDGTVSITTGSVDLTGTRTSLAMQAAEVLEIPLERVRAQMGDTDSVAYANVSAGSRTTMATGKAVVKAARSAVAELRHRAAVLWKVEDDAVEYGKGVFLESGGERKLTFSELAAQLPATGGMLTTVGNVNVTKWGASFATHIVDVEVDPETGRVNILRYTAVQDVGRAIHPLQVEGQIRGGAAQGIGSALYEGYVYSSDGRLLNGSLLDQRMPTAVDVPHIEPVLVEVPYPDHPFGVRGVGEIPIIPPAAAIANAISHAVGHRVCELPMTPLAVLKATGVIGTD